MVSSLKNNVSYKNVNHSYATNPVIRGDFPAYEDIKQLPVFKFNRFLSFVLGLSILVSMISYSLVVAKESAIASMHNKTNDITFENLDLQNKVDYAKSFNNINDKITKVNFLKKADKILEVNALASNANVIQKNNTNKVKIKPVSGY